MTDNSMFLRRNNVEKLKTSNARPLITETTWDPSKGLAARQAEIEERIRAQHAAEVEAYRADPNGQRLEALEAKVGLIAAQLERVLLKLGTDEVLGK